MIYVLLITFFRLSTVLKLSIKFLELQHQMVHVVLRIEVRQEKEAILIAHDIPRTIRQASTALTYFWLLQTNKFR